MMTDTPDERVEPGSDANNPASVRYPTAIAIGGGVAAAVGSSFIPMNAIEGFVSAYGIAELLPAAAPPLGNTARLVLSTGIGTLTTGALLALLPRGEIDDMRFETAERHETALKDPDQEAATATGGFGASKLAGWLRTLRFGKTEAAEGEVTDFSDLRRLRMRTADGHPDAPVRAPIMASSDLGGPIDATEDRATPEAAMAPTPLAFENEPFDLEASMAFAPPEPTMPMGAPTLRFAPPVEIETDGEASMAERESDTPSSQDFARSDGNNNDVFQPPIADASPLDATPDDADLATLGIPELLDRLESGLARRRQQASLVLAASAGDPAATGRVIPMMSAPAYAQGPAEAELASRSGQPSLRFRIGQPRLDDDTDNSSASASGLAGASAGWEDGDSLADLAALPKSDGHRAADLDTNVPVDMSVAGAPADDDMDAALRDALATLRQLSDRQRNV